MRPVLGLEAPPKNNRVAYAGSRSSSTVPQPVEGLEISLDTKGNRVLLSWKKSENTLEYLVQFSDSFSAIGWKDLKTTSGSFALDAISSEKSRFYRIVSLE